MARTYERNTTRYWFDNDLPGLSLMCADFTRQDYPPHLHDGFVIAITEAGGSIIKSRGVVDEARPSSLLVFNPDEPHAGTMGRSQHWRYRSLYLSDDAIKVVAQGLGIDDIPRFNRNIFLDPDLIQSFLSLHYCLDGNTNGLLRQELLIGTFGSLFRRHGHGGSVIDRAPRDRMLIRQVMQRMTDQFADDLSLEELSRSVGLTPFQLIGLFKRGIGLTPHAYLMQIRLEHARDYLRRGIPIAQAAVMAGFYDQSAFTTYFRRCHGITPKQFVKAIRQVES
ncbi:AraC family transcriptional regulator [Gluconacetobacter azotocaptans]|uniref:helix-turn-helix transcriptional regulator n=1 Tax=Gluconacetobacter azotocaptans TaxID=142834 RepID=UPI001957EFAB|nr:AraC family transcriptional regulator [Gluconacetobacter azotocaptans]MBM9402067.1 AraC family transcriptional regulator [Gluconacetobacter azotocaptans]